MVRLTLPNKLTMLRILLIPVMIVIWYIPFFRETMVFNTGNGFFNGLSLMMLLEFVIFAVASFTDFLDGKIARKRNLITSFGKFADPLADKMLVFTAMVLIMVDVAKWGDWYWNIMPVWAFVVMLVREFMVSGIRMVVASKGTVIPAAKMGKWKTATTMFALIFLFFLHTHIVVAIIGMSMMYVACLLTIISGIEYFINSKDVILESI